MLYDTKNEMNTDENHREISFAAEGPSDRYPRYLPMYRDNHHIAP